MKAELIDKIEKACRECKPDSVFVAVADRGGITRIDPQEILELISYYRMLRYNIEQQLDKGVRFY